MSLTYAQIKALAPFVRLHPKETYFPMNPIEFIRISRFRHHKALESDQGYNKTYNSWVTGNFKTSAYYDIPVNFINAYGLHSNGDNRRPRDPNCGDSWNVFLQPDGKPSGIVNPTGSVPVFYFQSYVDTTPFYQALNIPCEQYDLVQFWWFFGYNKAWKNTFNHQGDWEHISFKIKNNKIIKMICFGHGSFRSVPFSQIKMLQNRPVVYCAQGSHASYEKAGNFDFNIIANDNTANNGVQWDTSFLLSDLSIQPWKDFAGAWGEVGEFSATTGPLGPWVKRDRLII